MKPLIQDSVGAAMATKCSSNATMVTEYTVPMRSNRGHRHAFANHRKSAVELLEASKGEYVKSTKVLNHKQKLKHPENLSVRNREAPILSLPITGKQSPFEDAINISIDSTIINSSCQATPTKDRSHSRSPPTLHSENLKSSADNSKSPIAVKKLPCSSDSSSVSHSTEANDIVPSSISSTISSVSSTTVSASPLTISSSSSVRKASVVSSSASFTSSPSAAKKASTTSSVGSSLSYSSSHGNCKHDDDLSSFKKTLTSPVSAVRPVVPPKPANKPAVAPKLGPKPVIQKTEKPVPPPRPARSVPTPNKGKALDEKTDTSERTMSSTDKNTSMSSNNQMPNGPEQKRFSSVSASACETSSKESDSVDDSKGKSRSARESRYSLSSQSDVFLKPLGVNNLSTSVGVLVERKRSPIPKPRIDKQLNEVELPPRRPLHRSQSDLSNCRHSRTSSDFSDLSSRLSRTSTEVERFFNEMGIDHSVLGPMRRLSETRRREHVDSVSSFDSLDGRSLSSRLSFDLDRLPMESEQDLSERDPGTTSVVERNARIIKWLCNVKKARTVQTKHVNRKS